MKTYIGIQLEKDKPDFFTSGLTLLDPSYSENMSFAQSSFLQILENGAKLAFQTEKDSEKCTLGNFDRLLVHHDHNSGSSQQGDEPA